MFAMYRASVEKDFTGSQVVTFAVAATLSTAGPLCVGAAVTTGADVAPAPAVAAGDADGAGEHADTAIAAMAANDSHLPIGRRWVVE